MTESTVDRARNADTFAATEKVSVADIDRIHRALADASPLAVWAGRLGEGIRYFNQRWYDYTGLTPEQSLGEAWLDAIHPDDRATVMALRSDPDRPPSFDLEARVRRRDGQYRWHVGHVSVVDDGAGEPFVFGTALDIEDQRRADEALRSSEMRRTRAQDAGRLGTFEWDVRTNEVIWDGIEPIHGLEPGAFGGDFASYARDIHPDDRDQVLRSIQDAVDAASELEMEYRICCPNGSIRWVASHSRVERDDTGAPLRLVGVCQDVTQRRQAEEALRVRVAQQSSVAGIGQAALSSIDLQQVFDLAAKELAAHLHVERAAVLELLPSDGGLLMRSSVGWQVGASGSSKIDARASHAGYTLEAGEPVIMVDARRETRFALPKELLEQGVVSGMVTLVQAGERTWGAVSVHTVEHRAFTQDDVYHLQSVANVLGQAILRSEIEEALRAANDAKDEFLGLVSHELKTPITVIMGNAKLVTREHGRLAVEDVAAALDDIASESERLSSIIDNLLILARLEIGQSPAAEPCSIIGLLDLCVSDALRRSTGRAIGIKCDGGRPIVLAEPTYVRQVLANLLSNALKYSPHDEPVEVVVGLEGRDGYVRVLDRGSGIEDAEHDRLFEPFYRAPGAARNISGVGIGLTVCKRLIEAQGGRIWARPRAGGGADVGFSLPLVVGDS